jgi:hypothetical protein
MHTTTKTLFRLINIMPSAPSFQIHEISAYNINDVPFKKLNPRDFEAWHLHCVNPTTNLIMYDTYSQNNTVFSVSSIIDIQLH